MARGTQLGTIVEMVKAELMADIDDAISPGGDATLRLQASMQQKWLALRYDWPFLIVERTVNMVAGTRYYDFPQESSADVFELGRPIEAHCYWGGLWNPIELGINPSHYNLYNPADNQRADPVSAWQLYKPTGAVQFEVWPLPATTTQIRLRGMMRLPTLASDTDTAVLDDILLAQFTAAKLATRMKQADAQALLAQANETLRQLRAGYPSEATSFNMNGNAAMPRDWQRPTVATMISP